MFALFKNGKQITKAHPHKAAVIVEAFERNLIHRGIEDFYEGNPSHATVALDADHEIREVSA